MANEREITYEVGKTYQMSCHATDETVTVRLIGGQEPKFQEVGGQNRTFLYSELSYAGEAEENA